MPPVKGVGFECIFLVLSGISKIISLEFVFFENKIIHVPRNKNNKLKSINCKFISIDLIK